MSASATDIFHLDDKHTVYRNLGKQFVKTEKVDGREILVVEPQALTELAKAAFVDIAHFLRADHLKNLSAILSDPEASENDRFVAVELLRNACIAAGGTLPMCQDTGTAIVVAHKGDRVWTGADDASALSEGIKKTYAECNLRYSQMAPLNMYQEVNTGSNLPAQIDIYSEPGDKYEFFVCSQGRWLGE